MNLYRKSRNKTIRCLACQRKCLIKDTQVGFCLSRQNLGGKLKSLNYGQITGIQADPIEKKPFYHFKPGSIVATLGTYGCNFRCKQCLNSWCSWGSPASKILTELSLKFPNLPKTLTSTQIAKSIINSGYQGIAFSFNEPVIWPEFAADIAREFKLTAVNDKQSAISNKLSAEKFAVFVTNGSWTKETIDLLTSETKTTGGAMRGHRPTARNEVSTGGGAASDRPCSLLINAANIDFKGFSDETYKKMGAYFKQIPEMAVYTQKKGIFLEITTLLIPTINDQEEELKKMTNWIVKNLGPDTPWHLSQFDPVLAPDKDFKRLPVTSVESLKKAEEIGRKEGLNHIYIWAPQDNFAKSDTFCPKCKNMVIHRSGWQVKSIKITCDSRCQFCHYKLNVIL